MNDYLPTEYKDTYMHIRDARKILGVCNQTLHNWDKKGQIRTARLPCGARLIHKQDIYDIIGVHPTPTPKQKIIYCRVSSQKQKDDLARQSDLLRSQYPNHTLVTDIGSGINWKRKGLQAILESALSGNLEELVVAHRDRLCRFAFELIEFVFSKTNSKLIVLDTEAGKSSDQELSEDILSIIHVYSCRSMGKRRYSSKKNPTVPQCEPEEDSQAMDWDDEVGVQSSC
jgi:predicted site-specific integrase-resolvase